MERINVLIMSLGAKYGGSEMYTQTLIKSINQDHFSLFCVVRKNSKLEKKLNGQKTISIDLSPKSIVRSITQVWKFIKTKNITILHANGINAMFFTFFMPTKVKKIAVIHGDTYLDHKGMGFFKERIFPLAEVFLCNRFDQCIAVSHSLKTLLINRGVNPQKIQVVYNGIEVYDYDCRQHFGGKLKICAIGNLLPVKNHIVLLEAVRKFNSQYPMKSIQCDIYGVGVCEKNLIDYIKINNLKNVSIKGFNNSIRDVLNQYHVLIQPSIYESFGLSIVEAINAGCYVIATNVGGIKEIMNFFYERGKLVPVNNSDAIVDAINAVYDDRSLLYRGIENCQKTLVSHFSNKVMINHMEKEYEKNKNN